MTPKTTSSPYLNAISLPFSQTHQFTFILSLSLLQPWVSFIDRTFPSPSFFLSHFCLFPFPSTCPSSTTMLNSRLPKPTFTSWKSTNRGCWNMGKFTMPWVRKNIDLKSLRITCNSSKTIITWKTKALSWVLQSSLILPMRSIVPCFWVHGVVIPKGCFLALRRVIVMLFMIPMNCQVPLIGGRKVLLLLSKIKANVVSFF